MIDEFITASHTKWGQSSGVVLLLPHGYEGQGPDHSSARIERFLQMCADDAFVVAQPSTPASYFHLLRRHTLGDEHRPMVVFTPKSMLRRKEAASQPEDFTEGTFRALIGDEVADPDKVDTLLLCSGRITWDLMVERAKQQGDAPTTAIARFEQLYPEPRAELIVAEIGRYPNLRDDPVGAGRAGQHGPGAAPAAQRVRRARPPVQVISRPASSSPVGGRALTPRRGAEGHPHRGVRRRREHVPTRTTEPVYFTDRGVEELASRRGDEEVTLAWLAERLSEFTDVHPEFETAVERFATWLARLDDPDDD